MSHPNTTFDKPLFPLLPDDRERFYANVDNRIVCFDQHGNARAHHAVVVPTALFTLMRETFKVDPSEEVTLYLAVEGPYFVFGMSWGESDNNVADLWAYTKARLPNFLRKS